MDHYGGRPGGLTTYLDLKSAFTSAFHRRAASGALSGRHGERGGQGGHHQRGAAADGEDTRHPGGLPKEVFDDFSPSWPPTAPILSRHSGGPFYATTRPGAKGLEATIQNWWRQGMMGGAKAHYDGYRRLLTDRLHAPTSRRSAVPVLVMHGDDDQIVPYADSHHVRQVAEERHVEDLQGLSARYAHHGSGHD